MPELDLQPLVTPRSYRYPCIQIAVLWPQDDGRNSFLNNTAINPKRDDAVAWGISVAGRWFEDRLVRPDRLNIDLTVHNVIAPWTKAELDGWGSGATDLLWFKRMFQHPTLALQTWTSAAALIAVCPSAVRYPFNSGFAWGGTASNRWDNPYIPPVIALGEYHYSMFQTRNAPWTRWLSTVPGWWPSFQHRWQYASGLLCHEMTHALGDLWEHTDGDDILNPAMVQAWPAAGLSERQKAALVVRSYWL